MSRCVAGDQQLSDAFQEWINILQSIQLTFALLPVLHFTSSKKIMGKAATTPYNTHVCVDFRAGVPLPVLSSKR